MYTINTYMIDEYNGSEIITEIKRNRRGLIIVSQSIDVKCSKCGIIKKVNYWAHRKNRYNTLKKDPTNTYKCHTCVSSILMSSRNKKLKNKTLEEIYGKAHAKQIKKKMQINAKNNKNPLWISPPRVSGIKHAFFNKTYEQIFGPEKAILRRKQCAHFGNKNAQYGKPSHQGSGNGWSGWYKGWYFRSIRELSFVVNYLEKNNILWESAEQQKYAIPYIHYNGQKRNYFADFLINNNTLVEIKPFALINTPLVMLKKEAAEKWCGINEKTYKIISDKEFDILDKQYIIKLYDKGMIKWLEKYKEKYEIMYIR